jgi:hypothetical protein
MNIYLTIAIAIAAVIIFFVLLRVWLKTMAKRREASQSFIDYYNDNRALIRPIFSEWIVTNSGEYFRKASVIAMTKNPNGTMNIIFGNGHSINTGLLEDEIIMVLDIQADNIYKVLSEKRKFKEEAQR